MKVTYHVASSLDGFIADRAGGVGWLDDLSIDPASTGFAAFYADVDGLVLGRGTYDFLLDHGSWPYGDQPCWIDTSRPVEVLPGCNRQPATDPAGAFREARAAGVRHLWVVGGGRLAATLAGAGLLTHVHVTLMPVALGSGIPLFGALDAPLQLEQEGGRIDGGLCEVRYRVGAPERP